MNAERFSIVGRSVVLDRLINAFKDDRQICGIILVGSGAVGFADQYSDLDFCVVVSDDCSLRDTYDLWGRRIEELFPVLLHQKVDKSAHNLLHVVVLESLLELDLGFLKRSHLAAAKPRWKVVYDRDGELDEHMKTSWEERQHKSTCVMDVYADTVEKTWYPALHALIAIRRDQPWRASFEFSLLRELVIQGYCTRQELTGKRWRDLDSAENLFKEALLQTLPNSLDTEALKKAYVAVLELLLQELAEWKKRLAIAPGKEISFLRSLISECTTGSDAHFA